MSDEPFGRQLKPVLVAITGGEAEDRRYWQSRIAAFLSHQPCVTIGSGTPTHEFIRINPDVNND